jgi:hypothetical protein
MVVNYIYILMVQLFFVFMHGYQQTALKSRKFLHRNSETTWRDFKAIKLT